MKNYVVGATFNIPKSPHSHKAGWAHLRANQLSHWTGEKVEVCYDLFHNAEGVDKIYLYHGTDWNGSLNRFGGLKETDIQTISAWLYGDHELSSLDILCPGYLNLLRARKDFDPLAKPEDFSQRLEAAFQFLSNSRYVVPYHTKSKVLIIGDSHAGSVYTGGASVLRNDFKTLNGALSSHLIEKSLSTVSNDIDRLVLYFGNIDIRHHIYRLAFNDYKAVEIITELVAGYVHMIRALKEKLLLPKTKVTVVVPLFIENESRKLPKTGYHEGKPFWGTWAQRNHARELMTQLLDEHASEGLFEVYHHHPFLKNELGELSFAAMERPQSVHLSPAFHVWDYWNDQPNSILGAQYAEAHKLMA